MSSSTLPAISASSSAVNRPLAGFRFVTIRHGDTLQTIAARELNDTSKWTDLIAINGLSYPYITENAAKASATVKMPGQLIVVPAAVAQVQANTDAAAVFGTDLLLKNGLLTASNGDFATVSGLPNLVQALLNRLGTSLRELLWHLDYGNGARRIVGRVNGPTALQLGTQYVQACLLQETRLSAVNSVNGTLSGDQLQVAATVTPITSAPINISTTV